MSIRIRRGTDIEWEANKSKILPGEPAVTTDTGRFFVGINGGFAEFAKKEDVRGLESLGTVAYGGTKNITIPNSTDAIIFGFGASGKAVLYILSASITGEVAVTAFSGAATYTTSTNTFSITATQSTYRLYYIATNTLS